MFAYASPTRCSTHNLISLLSKHKSLSLQGAMNYAGGMVKETLQEFHHLERQLLPSRATTTGDKGSGETSWSWLWSIPAVMGLGEGLSTNSASPANRHYLSGIQQTTATSPTADGWNLDELGENEPSQFDSNEQYDQAQVARYVLSLRDYIIGSIHWGYETELYFGQKGGEIRSFGWVFLSSS